MQTKEKNKKLILKVILSGAILITLALLVMFAYAKYMTSVRGETSEEIAKWKFNVTTNGVPISSEIIDFAITRDINDTDSVARGTIAPGTFGVFELIVNTEGTETLAEYNIKIDLVDCPTNLKFYFDSEYTQELKKERINEVEQGNETITTDELNLYRYIPLNEHGEFTERIYWEWPLQTGNTQEEIYKSNLEDSKWLAKEKMTMKIAAVSEQVLEEPVHLVTYSKPYQYCTYGMYSILGEWNDFDNIKVWTCTGLNEENFTSIGPFIVGFRNRMKNNKKYRITMEAKANREIKCPYRFEADKDKKRDMIDLTTEYKIYYLDVVYDETSNTAGVVFYTKDWQIGDQIYIKNFYISEIVTNGTQYGELYIPEIEDYIFDGWYTNEKGGTKITANSRVNLTENIILYPHWKEESEE